VIDDDISVADQRSLVLYRDRNSH